MRCLRTTRPRSVFLCVALFAANGAFAVRAAAQGSPASQAARAASIVLPPRMLPGEQATLAVLDNAGRLVPGAAVEFPGAERVTTDATGRAAFVAPLTPGVLTARLPERNATASATVLAPRPVPNEGLQVTGYPRVISVTDRFPVEGFGFSGRADANHVTLGEKTAAVLASSPVALVVMPAPGLGIGPAPLAIEASGRSSGALRVTLVLLRVRGPDSPLTQGQRAKLTVQIRGTDLRLPIEARNLTPKVVDFPRGNVLRVVSSGGVDNQAQIEMTGLATGDYSVSVRLVPGAASLPDMEAVREKLLAARKIATGDWPVRLDRVIRRIERDPQDVSHVRDDLEKMLAQYPEAELGRQIEAAWKLLLKR